MRDDYEKDGLHGMVLAINYELISDATRALDALRRIEELTPDHQISVASRTEIEALREQLNPLTSLPALPRWRVQDPDAGGEQASHAEIERLHAEYRRRSSA
jgi:hypothetical protein